MVKNVNHRVRAQRKFAQGAYIPPIPQQERSPESTSAPTNNDNPNDMELNVCEFLNMLSLYRTHRKEPVVILERLLGYSEPQIINDNPVTLNVQMPNHIGNASIPVSRHPPRTPPVASSTPRQSGTNPPAYMHLRSRILTRLQSKPTKPKLTGSLIRKQHVTKKRTLCKRRRRRSSCTEDNVPLQNFVSHSRVLCNKKRPLSDNVSKNKDQSKPKYKKHAGQEQLLPSPSQINSVVNADNSEPSTSTHIQRPTISGMCTRSRSYLTEGNVAILPQQSSEPRENNVNNVTEDRGPIGAMAPPGVFEPTREPSEFDCSESVDLIGAPFRGWCNERMDTTEAALHRQSTVATPSVCTDIPLDDGSVCSLDITNGSADAWFDSYHNRKFKVPEPPRERRTHLSQSEKILRKYCPAWKYTSMGSISKIAPEIIERFCGGCSRCSIIKRVVNLAKHIPKATSDSGPAPNTPNTQQDTSTATVGTTEALDSSTQCQGVPEVLQTCSNVNDINVYDFNCEDEEVPSSAPTPYRTSRSNEPDNNSTPNQHLLDLFPKENYILKLKECGDEHNKHMAIEVVHRDNLDKTVPLSEVSEDNRLMLERFANSLKNVRSMLTEKNSVSEKNSPNNTQNIIERSKEHPLGINVMCEIPMYSDGANNASSMAAARPFLIPAPLRKPYIPFAGPSAPAIQPSKSVARPSAPATRASKSVARSSKSVARPSKSVARPSKSVARPSKSVARPSKSVARPPKSVARPSKSVARPSTPTTQPPTSAARPSAPAIQPPTSAARPPKSVARPSKSVARPSAPTTQPPTSAARPSAPAIQPPTSAARPSAPATQPPTSAARPSAPATQPPTSAARPSAPATQPPTSAARPSAPATQPPTSAARPSAPATQPPTSAARPSAPATQPPTSAARPSAPATQPPTSAAWPSAPATQPPTTAARLASLAARPSTLADWPITPEAQPSTSGAWPSTSAVAPSTSAAASSTSETRNGILDAPTFYPTAEEMSMNFIDYVQKIAPEATEYGICKITIPKELRPEFNMKNIQFKCNNQYISIMYQRWVNISRQMTAIKAHLGTQNVSFTRPPLFEGVEVDLVKLYHVVQSYGGLKAVIEQQKWPQVAEDMRLNSGRFKAHLKLDKIYCKHLLPYDTLSDAEREDLLRKIDSIWEKKHKKMVARAANPLHRMRQILEESDSSEDESEPDADRKMFNAFVETEECVLPGQIINYERFQKIAEQVQHMHFPVGEIPSPEVVERLYWLRVLRGDEHVCVHNASLDTSVNGLGFPPYYDHPWNLKRLGGSDTNVLSALGPTLAVTVPTLQLSMMFATNCWHKDPHHLPWTEYMHEGAAKIWYGIPDQASAMFREVVQKLCPGVAQNKSIWLPSDLTMIPPELLVQHGIQLSRLQQKPGDYVLVFPRAYSCSISTGTAISESLYFASEIWLSRVQRIFEEMRNNCEPAMFSLEQLALGLWRGKNPTRARDLLMPILTAERDLRKEAQRRKVKSESTSEFLARNGHMKTSAWQVKRDECEVCRTTVYLSKVIGVTPARTSVCLSHGLKLYRRRRSTKNEITLIVFISNEEIENMITLIDKISQI